MNQRVQRSTNRNFAASHQRSWLWGRHAVLETLRAGKWPIRELYFSKDLPFAQLDEVQQLAASSEIPVQIVTATRIDELCRTDQHQGFLARMGEFPCGTLADLNLALKRSKAAGDTRTDPSAGLFVICDRIQDAHNFGAILRCCDAMRVDGIVIGEKSQVSITPHVARSSSGAVNHQTIFCVPSLPEAIHAIRSAGFSVVAASEKAETKLWQADLRQSVCILIGTEANGISPELLSQCGIQVAIPMLGGVNSLNAAVAAGIVLYECRRQQMVTTRTTE